MQGVKLFPFKRLVLAGVPQTAGMSGYAIFGTGSASTDLRMAQIRLSSIDRNGKAATVAGCDGDGADIPSPSIRKSA